MTASPQQHLTLYDLQRMVRSSLEERFALPVWISAEISELKVNYSGHCYINLVEKGAADGVPRAEARAVIWRNHFSKISAYFTAQTGAALAAGIRILAKVLVSYHEVYGFSLQITDIDPAYTMGEVERRRRETIRQLQQEGVWDMNRELPLPRLVRRIAVISSASAAGYRDFMREIGSSDYDISTELFEAVMQGAAAEESVIAALERIAAREEEFDAVAVIRGGGSASDLSAFDSYRMAAHAAQFPLPVFAGIGHDKDTSVVDMVAHTSLKTPTAVAASFVERMDSEQAWIEAAAERLRQMTADRLHDEHLTLERRSAELHRATISTTIAAAARLDSMAERLRDYTLQLLTARRRRLQAAEEITRSRSVDNILRLGFSVVRIGGKAVASAGAICPGTRLDIELSDGRLQAEVTAAGKPNLQRE
ncbi:MAG: exodeoxyribonuclease VII large subunit [Alistipes sp.]|nr:exodeoxyribonuclease VII large subunit [Alistipes sp.]